MMRKFWLSIIGVCDLILGSHLYFSEVNTKKTFTALKAFAVIPYTNTFEVAHPRVSFAQPKVKKAVLLLHGFSSSPRGFRHLTERLDQEGIPYYAPLMNGFGMGDFHLLNVIEPTDWVRDSIFGFDLLSSFAEEVDVIGHSNGGSLAVLVAAHRPVHQVILSAPNLFPTDTDRFYKRILEAPLVGELFAFVYPVFMKPVRHGRVTSVDMRDPQAASHALQYQGLPIQSLKTLWVTQNWAQHYIPSLRSKKLILLYGDHDQSVNIPAAVAAFEENDVEFQTLRYTNSAHDILSDADRTQVIEDVIRALKQG
jgi:carboxylesterase